MALPPIVADYFDAHPEAVEGVGRAFFAYHAAPAERGHHFGDRPGDPDYRHRPCAWCGRTRWAVRHGEAPPACVGKPDTAAVLAGEERAFLSVLASAPAVVAKHVPDPAALTGERLAWLHHTHGLYPEAVEGALDTRFPVSLLSAYEAAYDLHRSRST